MAKAIKNAIEDSGQPEKERTTIYLRRDLYKKLKYVCFKDESSQTDVIAIALADYFSKWEHSNGKIVL